MPQLSLILPAKGNAKVYFHHPKSHRTTYIECTCLYLPQLPLAVQPRKDWIYFRHVAQGGQGNVLTLATLDDATLRGQT